MASAKKGLEDAQQRCTLKGQGGALSQPSPRIPCGSKREGSAFNEKHDDNGVAGGTGRWFSFKHSAKAHQPAGEEPGKPKYRRARVTRNAKLNTKVSNKGQGRRPRTFKAALQQNQNQSCFTMAWDGGNGGGGTGRRRARKWTPTAAAGVDLETYRENQGKKVACMARGCPDSSDESVA